MPLPTLPFPLVTDDEIFELLEAQNLRLDKAWSGLKEVVSRHMPGQCARYNQHNSRNASKALKPPKDYYTAGADLLDRALPAILVGGEMEFNAFGMGAYLGHINSCVWIVTKPNLNEDDIRDASLLADIVFAILRSYEGGYVNAYNQRLWGSLQPQAVRAIPKNEKSFYSGFFVAVEVVQGPDVDAASLFRSPLPDAP